MLLNPQTLRVSCFQTSTYICWRFHAVTKLITVSPLLCSLRNLHQSELLITQLKPLRVEALRVESGFHFHDDLCMQELWNGIPEVLYQNQKTKAYTNLQEDTERLDRTFIFPLDTLPFVYPQPSNSLSTFPRQVCV